MWGRVSKERDLLAVAKQAKEAEVDQLKKELQQEQEKNMKLEMRLQAWVQDHGHKVQHNDALVGELATENEKTKGQAAEITQLKAAKLLLEEEVTTLRPVKEELEKMRTLSQTSQKGFADLQELFNAQKAQIEAARQDQGAAKELMGVKAELNIANTELAKLRGEVAALKSIQVTLVEERKMHAQVEARLQDSIKASTDAAASHQLVAQELVTLQNTHLAVKEKHDYMHGNWEVKEAELKGHQLTIADLRKENAQLTQGRDSHEAALKSAQSNLQATKLLHKAEQTSAKELLGQLTELKSAYEQATFDRDAARGHLKQAQEERMLALHGMNNLRGALSSVAPLFEPLDMPYSKGFQQGHQFAIPTKPQITAAHMLQPQLPGQLQDM